MERKLANPSALSCDIVVVGLFPDGGLGAQLQGDGRHIRGLLEQHWRQSGCQRLRWIGKISPFHIRLYHDFTSFECIYVSFPLFLLHLFISCLAFTSILVMCDVTDKGDV